MTNIESLLERLWHDGYSTRESYEKNESDNRKTSLRQLMTVKWVLLPISGNEMLVCDGCYKAIKRQEMHIDMTNESKKVLCEECWKGEVEANE